jgi:hypothetical protein
LYTTFVVYFASALTFINWHCKTDGNRELPTIDVKQYLIVQQANDQGYMAWSVGQASFMNIVVKIKSSKSV